MKADESAVTYDHMVQYFHVQQFGRGGEGFGNIQVLLRRFRIAGRVVMNQDETISLVPYAPLQGFLNIHRRSVQISFRNHAISQKAVLYIDISCDEMFLILVTQFFHEKGCHFIRRAETDQLPLIADKRKPAPQFYSSADGDSLVRPYALDISEIPPVQVFIAVDTRFPLQKIYHFFRNFHNRMALPAGTKKNGHQIRITGKAGRNLESFSWFIFASHFPYQHDFHLIAEQSLICL